MERPAASVLQKTSTRDSRSNSAITGRLLQRVRNGKGRQHAFLRCQIVEYARKQILLNEWTHTIMDEDIVRGVLVERQQSKSRGFRRVGPPVTTRTFS